MPPGRPRDVQFHDTFEIFVKEGSTGICATLVDDENISVASLALHVNKSITRIEEVSGKSIGSITIGKTFINNKLTGTPIDRKNILTWTTEGILSRWNTSYKENGYCGLIAIQLFQDQSSSLSDVSQTMYDDWYFQNQQTALEVERNLVEYLMRNPILLYTKKGMTLLDNTSTNQGKASSGEPSDGYIVYMAVREITPGKRAEDLVKLKDRVRAAEENLGVAKQKAEKSEGDIQEYVNEHRVAKEKRALQKLKADGKTAQSEVKTAEKTLKKATKKREQLELIVSPKADLFTKLTEAAKFELQKAEKARNDADRKAKEKIENAQKNYEKAESLKESDEKAVAVDKGNEKLEGAKENLETGTERRQEEQAPAALAAESISSEQRAAVSAADEADAGESGTGEDSHLDLCNEVAKLSLNQSGRDNEDRQVTTPSSELGGQD